MKSIKQMLKRQGGTKMHSPDVVEEVCRIKGPSYPGGFVGFLLRRLGRADAKGQAVIKQMRLIETLSLGGKRNVMLISCAGELFLVGGSFESIESIVRVHGEISQSIAIKKADSLCL